MGEAVCWNTGCDKYRALWKNHCCGKWDDLRRCPVFVEDGTIVQRPEVVFTKPGFKPKESESQGLIRDECNHIMSVLLDKNRKYGDSAINPRRLFSKAEAIEQINVRLDDKISRLESGQTDEDEDVELDII